MSFSLLFFLFFSPLFFSFNDPATTEIYTLSLHDALPISASPCCARLDDRGCLGWKPNGELCMSPLLQGVLREDRKSTRLNSSHTVISYAVFCLKKKKKKENTNKTWNVKIAINE